MNVASVLRFVVLCLWPCFTASAAGFQSYEAGISPISSRIQTLDGLISATNARLAVPDISSEERELRMNCLKQYTAEKEQLVADLEAGRKISQLPGVIYLAEADEHKCSIGLTYLGTPSSRQAK